MSAEDNMTTDEQTNLSSKQPHSTSKPTPSALQAQKQAEEAGNRHDQAVERRWKTIESVMLWIAWVAMVAFNGYAEVFKFNGTTTGTVAYEANVWFMPAGYAFAIWGLIYILLAAWLVRFCIAGPSRKRLGKLPMSLSGLLFIASCILNIAWLACWHLRSFTIALIVIVALTAIVWWLYFLVRRDDRQADTSSSVRLLDWVPLSVYGGWLSVATVLNAFYDAEVLSGGISDVIQVFAVIILLGLLLLLALLMMQQLADWAFGLVIVWSALAIGIQVLNRNTAIAVLIIAMAAIGVLLVYFPWNKFKLVHR